MKTLMTAKSTAPTSTDRIEKHFEVKAKRARVWRALADAEEFGAWFGMKLDRPLVPGATVRGQLTIKGYEHVTLEMQIEKVEPEGYFSYRWHPNATDPALDYKTEPMTLVEFKLRETASGTAVTIIESGFDALPASRRAEAFRSNDGGWTGQSKRLAQYVE
ncbi:MAG: SRPBCC family protein [Gemmatimonadales bacterium]